MTNVRMNSTPNIRPCLWSSAIPKLLLQVAHRVRGRNYNPSAMISTSRTSKRSELDPGRRPSPSRSARAMGPARGEAGSQAWRRTGQLAGQLHLSPAVLPRGAETA